MPESNVDIDRLGTLTLDHFESYSTSEGSSNSDQTSNNYSSPSNFAEDFESPVSSPNQVSSPSCSSDNWNSNSEEEISDEKTVRIKSKEKRTRQTMETVSKRNERERKRVKLISEGFSTLRKHILIHPNNRKLPKLQILRRAIYYIKALQEMLDESDSHIKLENQRKFSPCTISYPQTRTQIPYLYSTMDDRSNIPPSCPPTFQRPYLDVYQHNRCTIHKDTAWSHGYTQ